MKYWVFIINIIVIATLSGCSSTPVVPNTTYNDSLTEQLKHQLVKWKGVPYQYGGLNKRGIDCSGFVYLTFRDILNIQLPRTTKEQEKLGTLISPSQLNTGDLVFFKTGNNVRHVGIYLRDKQFLHASTSKGVIISRLDNVYWRKKFWKAKRL